MGILTSDLQKILEEETDLNSPVSEQLLTKLGASINGLIDLSNQGWEIFTSSGTWTCPDNVDRVDIIGCGGGQGGTYTGGGNGAVPMYLANITVVPTTVYSINIGSGGFGDSSTSLSSAIASTWGGNTTINTPVPLSFRGAMHDLKAQDLALGDIGFTKNALGRNYSFVEHGSIYTYGGLNRADGGTSRINGASSNYNSGGLGKDAGSSGGSTNYRTGGGGAGFGKGGDGAEGSSGIAQNGGIGAGGGGAFGNFLSQTAGNGGSGILLIKPS